MPASSCSRPVSISSMPTASISFRASRSASVTNGSMTASTPSLSAASAVSSLTAARCSSVKGSPSVVLSTMLPVPPEASGIASWRCSVTSSVGVPGIENALESVPPNRAKAPAATARSTAHAVITVQARRAHQRPTR